MNKENKHQNDIIKGMSRKEYYKRYYQKNKKQICERARQNKFRQIIPIDNRSLLITKPIIRQGTILESGVYIKKDN